jgi:predicted nucleic acid-binding Zn ribbon protein
MPTYTYRCEECNEITEVFQPLEGARNVEILHPGHQKVEVKCEFCDSPKVHRILMDFPHIKFDYNAYYTRDVNPKLVLHAAKAGKSQPLSEEAGKRV